MAKKNFLKYPFIGMKQIDEVIRELNVLQNTKIYLMHCMAVLLIDNSSAVLEVKMLEIQL